MKKKHKIGQTYTRKCTGTSIDGERVRWRTNKRLAATRAYEAVEGARRKV